MPKPQPAYLPEALKGENVVTYKLSESLGLKRNRLYSFYRGKHTLFQNYCKLADAAGLSLDQFVDEIAENGWASLFLKLQVKHKKHSNYALAEHLGLNRSFIANKIAEGKSLNALKTYLELKEAENITLVELRSRCGL